MHDEFRSSLARQGIAEEAYLKAVTQTEADLHTEFRPRAEERVKTLLVLSKIAEVEGIEVTDADVEAEIAAARMRYADDPRTLAYFESERGRNFIRSTLRRTRTVEALVDALAGRPPRPSRPAARRGRTMTEPPPMRPRRPRPRRRGRGRRRSGARRPADRRRRH